MSQPRKLHVIKGRWGDGEDGMGASNSSWVALVLAAVTLPRPGAAWGCRVGPAAPSSTAGSGEEEGWSLHRQLCADVFH